MGLYSVSNKYKHNLFNTSPLNPTHIDLDTPLYFDTFKDGISINRLSENLILKYYNTRYQNEYPNFYHTSIVYNSIINDNRYKFIIFNVPNNNDTVMVIYKVVQMVTTKQIRVLDFPISINSNHKSEMDVLQLLMGLDFIRVSIPLDSAESCKYINNFNYSDYFVQLDAIKINSKFKKHKVGECIDNPKYTFNIINKPIIGNLYDKCMDLFEIWSGSKNVSKSSRKIFSKLIQSDSSSCIKVIVSYNDTPISVEVFIIDKYTLSGVCHSVFLCHMGRQCSDDPELIPALKNMVKLQTYGMWVLYTNMLSDMGINRCYVCGSRKGNAKLNEHKSRTCDGVFMYVDLI